MARATGCRVECLTTRSKRAPFSAQSVRKVKLTLECGDPRNQSRSLVSEERFLREMERGENANGQKPGQVRVFSRRLNFRQDLRELQDQLI
jgi:hypothetical protein